MIKHTQKIRRQHPTNGLGVFDHFVELAVKGIFLHLVKVAASTYSRIIFRTMYISKKCAKLWKDLEICTLYQG